MSYQTPDFVAIRARILRDVQNLDADAALDADSDNFIRACLTASVAEGLYDYQNWITRQIIPDTADSDYLEYHARLRGIMRKKATVATGTIRLSGVEGAVIPAGTRCKDAADAVYSTSVRAVVGASGTQDVPCAALVAGASPDVSNVPVVLLSAPSGLQSTAHLSLSGGTDAESDASLLARLLLYMRNPPGGGNAADYKRWALEMEGVTSATVYPLRQGAGTVDIVITGEEGIPSLDVVRACQAHIDAQRPCTASATVYAPTPQTINITLRLRVQKGQNLAGIRPAVLEVLSAQFALLAPGESLVLAKVLAAIAGLSVVTDAVITAPAANVTLSGLLWARLGTVTLEAL